MEYNFRKIEKEWQEKWAKEKTFAAKNNSDKPKYYVLDMFPYPSGAGLHVGHPLGYIASDIIARFKRHRGFNVLHPMGYDSFGLPAEQYAIQTGQHPAITTEQNINRYREQLDKIGFSFDWDREIRTSDPNYYKWTQWIFIQLFNAWYNPRTDKTEHIDSLLKIFETEGFKGDDHDILTGEIEHELPAFTSEEWKKFDEKKRNDVLMNFRIAYLGEAYVNWCPAMGTVLANDEVKDGVSERGGYPVERKLMKQWSMRITAYSQRLLDGLDKLEWSESLKESQRNWIGKSEGTSLKFEVSGFPFSVEVFTTRPDTIFGVSFVTLAPEHELVEKITTAEYKSQVEAYVTMAKNRSERERMADVKNVSGQFTGAYAIHPFTKKQIPIYIGDYVLAGYGTGAVMAVPGHDSRDHRFAKHFGLPIIKVVDGADVDEEANEAKEGRMMNSDFLNEFDVKDAIKKAIAEIEKNKIGKGKINFRLRDAVFGRQRYWGEPIPVYYKNGIPHTIPENELPLVLPEVDKFLPTEDGEPPLARAKNWTYTPHPNPPHGGGNETFPKYQTAKKSAWPHLKEFSKENRKNPTPEEELLWTNLKGEQLGCKFRRQHVIGNFIADFVCLDKKLVIEVDGEYHETQKVYDNDRTLQIEGRNFRVIRFSNEQIKNNLEKVISEIKSQLNKEFSDTSKVLPTGEDLGGATIQKEAYPLETTTMPGWAGSSWYYLRYMDAHNNKEFVSKNAADYWQNVDLYIGGSEHATGHLLYVRFWTMALKDLGFINVDEPAKKLINQGMIQGVSEKIFKYQGLSNNIDLYNINTGIIMNNLPVSNEPIQVFMSGSTYNTYVKNSVRDVYSAVNVPVNIVSSNSLDLNKFIAERKEFANSAFILDNGTYYIDGKIWDNNNFRPAVDSDFKYFKTSAEVEKMSKSKFNVVNPDDMCEQYGADTLRLYEMFLGPLELSKPWSTNGITGVHNFLKKLWKLFFPPYKGGVAPATGDLINVSEEAPTKEELKALHKTIKKISYDVEHFSFNTSVSNFMICVNELTDLKCNKRKILEPLLVLISPYAPHITEELWKQLGHNESIAWATWPEFNEAYLVESSFSYPISFNGKTRLQIELPLSLTKEQIESEVMGREEVLKHLNGGKPKRVIVVPNKIVNIVV